MCLVNGDRITCSEQECAVLTSHSMYVRVDVCQVATALHGVGMLCLEVPRNSGHVEHTSLKSQVCFILHSKPRIANNQRGMI